MMILPLQFAYFHTFQPLSILLNLIVVPYFSLFVIPLMFILIIMMPFFTPIIHLIDQFFVSIQSIFTILLEFFDQIFYYPFILGDFPILFTIVYYILFYLCMKRGQLNHLKKSFKYGCAVVLLIVCLSVRPYMSATGMVTMLDMGQGDVFVIELPYRKGVFFIDAGATFSFEDFKPTDQVYEQIIRPYLYSRGIGHVDAIFLSHAHGDHNGSVPFMVKYLGA